MAITNRTVSIQEVFASEANTTIPNPPVAGQSYRNTALTAEEIANGWSYKEIVDSAKFNQALYEYSSICKQLETYGFLPWSNLTDYEVGSLCLGTNGIVYQAKAASGPSSTTAQDPVYDTENAYWDVFYYPSFTADRALISNASGKVAASSVTSTELGYLSGAANNIQTQLNNKADNNAVVHTTGNETIYGIKILNDIMYAAASTNVGSVATTKSRYYGGNAGHVEFGNDLLIQWGRATVAGRTWEKVYLTDSQHIPFPTNSYIVILTDDGSKGQGATTFKVATGKNTNYFEIYADSDANQDSCSWIAIGRGS